MKAMSGKLDLSPREASLAVLDFPLALNALCNKQDLPSASSWAAISSATRQKAGLGEGPRNGLSIPTAEPLWRASPADLQKRDLTVGTSNAGGYLRGTENISFIEMLRNRMVAFQMGARRLSGLVGNVTIPKQTAAATAYWLANEATAITESQQTFGQLALTPRTVGAYTEISRLLQLQSSPDVQSLVTADLANVVARAMDLAVLAGTGTEQPTGIVNTSGIGTVLGMRAMSSAQCPAGTIIFGDFAQVVVAEWGTLELTVNENANFPAGISGIRAFYTCDVGLRYAGAFSVATSVT